MFLIIYHVLRTNSNATSSVKPSSAPSSLPQVEFVAPTSICTFAFCAWFIKTIFTENSETKISASLKICVSFLLLCLKISAQNPQQSWDSVCIYQVNKARKNKKKLSVVWLPEEVILILEKSLKMQSLGSHLVLKASFHFKTESLSHVWRKLKQEKKNYLSIPIRNLPASVVWGEKNKKQKLNDKLWAARN